MVLLTCAIMVTPLKGSGGPYDAPTGYVAPVMNLALPANTTYEYTFFLVLGDVATIRAYAQQVVEAARQEENSAKDQEAAASGTWEGCEVRWMPSVRSVS